MGSSKGHDSGHLAGEPVAAGVLPLSWSWQDTVDQLAMERGGLAELSRHLIDVAPASSKLSDDPQTVERGLRRLRGRGNGDGGRYGRLLLRCFGLPGAMLAWARELGQYHSRSSDLPLERRLDQLRRWDCPPMTDSAAAIWIQIGLASVAFRLGDAEAAEQRLTLARPLQKRAEPAARLELDLLEARFAFDDSRPEETRRHLDAITDNLADADLDGDARACYTARLHDQRAYTLSRGWRQHPEHLERALALYDAIPLDHAPPFAAFRRAHGRAWCLWRLGRRDDALTAAEEACTHTGDGGFIRFRIMSLTLMAHILGQGQRREALCRRAAQMAHRLGDVELSKRVEKLFSPYPQAATRPAPPPPDRGGPGPR